MGYKFIDTVFFHGKKLCGLVQFSQSIFNLGLDMSEISAIGGVEGPLAFESFYEENLEDALEDIGLFLRETPAVWAYTSATYFVVRAIFSTQINSRTSVAFEKLEMDMMQCARSLSFTPTLRNQIASDIESIAQEKPMVSSKALKSALKCSLKSLLAEVDIFSGGGLLQDSYILEGVKGTLFAIAHILRSSHLSPELTRKGEDILVILRQFPGHGSQNGLGVRTEIYHLIDLLEQA
ncbi:hypothetical protein [Candidatus Neptunichlamydia sp. REUL1]|uniref:hypothetical protein n=1 Tax=Candidatus Neptunichlamydia sp. REUL1 TaxID=3064277 RepID=UPI00292D7C3D|nr:hypothetical protein [Candidatus Neptunochlamydia sp. REUL1]